MATTNTTTTIPAGIGGQFINGYQLLDKNYVVSSANTADNAVRVGTFACKGESEGVCVGQTGEGEVIGFIPLQGYNSDVGTADASVFEAGDSVQIEVGSMAIYALDVGDSTGIKKNDYIGIKKADGTLYINTDKVTATTGDYKDTGYIVFQSNGIQTPGIIYIKRG